MSIYNTFTGHGSFNGLWYQENVTEAGGIQSIGSNIVPFNRGYWVGNSGYVTVADSAYWTGGAGAIMAMGSISGLAPSGIRLHGWNGTADNYTLTLPNLPAHTQARYIVRWHCVDSLDNETSNLFINDNSGEVEFLRFTKALGTGGISTQVVRSGLSTSWTTATYSTAPWPGASIDGYVTIDTGYFDHTLPTFTVRHFLGADQPQADEAMYLSHSAVYLR